MSKKEGSLRGRMADSGKTAEELDNARRHNMAYEYLCHLEEARIWMGACLETELPAASELETALQNGVIFVKLAIFFAPDHVKAKHIYDPDETVYKDRGLVFRHTDNISHWLKAMRKLKFPDIFYPEVTDIYDKKNMPRVIYCIHALSRYLYHLGIAPEMEDLHGIAQFTEEELSAMDQALQSAGVRMPQFNSIGGVLAKELGVDEAAMHAAILSINQHLEEEDDTEVVVKALRNPAAGLRKIEVDDGEKYRDQLINARRKKSSAYLLKKQGEQQTEGDEGEAKDTPVDIYDCNLTQEEIQSILNVVNKEVAQAKKEAEIAEAMQALQAALEGDDHDVVFAALQNPALELKNLNPELAKQYHKSLKKNGPLEKDALQSLIDETNEKGNLLDNVVEALQSGDSDTLLAVLKENKEDLKIEDPLEDRLKDEYFAALKPLQDSLTQEGIAPVIKQVHEKDAALKAVNEAIVKEDADATLVTLQHPLLELNDVDEAGAHQYQFELHGARQEADRDLSVGEIQKQIDTANLAAEENAKHAAAIFAINEALRAKKIDVLSASLKDSHSNLERVNPEIPDRYMQTLGDALKAKEEAAGRSKSPWKRFKTEDGRTYYYNKSTKETQWMPPADMDDTDLNLVEIQENVDKANGENSRHKELVSKTDIIIELQALIRGFLVRKKFNERKNYLKENEKSAVVLQSALRGILQRRKYKERLDYLNKQGDHAVKIQALWKGRKARREYENLIKVTEPPVEIVRKFLHLLDQSDVDFEEELKSQELKQKVITQIKQNNGFENDLNNMDIKIGLLVRNRIELQHVASLSKQLKKKRAKERGSDTHLEPSTGGTSLKSLTKDAREKLESYQHLFYLLQTQPDYLAGLVFTDNPLPQWSEHKTEKFLQHLIQTVYNYGSNNREKFLLLKLYRTALSLEIVRKIDSLKEFITGNPTVISLTINHHRGQNAGGTYLQDTLSDFVTEMLKDEDEVDLNTDPVEVYKKWVNAQEAETGEKSSLPYEVDRAGAMEHEHVRNTINERVEQLIKISTKCQDAIIAGLPNLPYGLRYICGAVRDDLRSKFPDSPEDDTVKVLGNILYYRYLNPALIAPEAYGVIELGMQQKVSSIQRRNLASVAKLLQFAASAQTPDQDGSSPLNAFLQSAWTKFKDYFLAAATVDSIETHFNIDEYSDATMLSKPWINISPREIYFTHEMLTHNAGVIAPDDDDQLHEILKDLGSAGDEKEVLGEEGTPQAEASSAGMTLQLVNKFEVPEEDDTSLKALFVRTKRMIIEVIRFQSGRNLKEILDNDAKPEELEEYKKSKKDFEEETNLDAVHPFVGLKTKVKANIDKLVEEDLCSADNNYQDLLNAIARDIRNQRIYRKQRRDEIEKLRVTLGELAKKKQFFTEQLDYYDQYVSSCMEQMMKSKTKKKRGLKHMFASNKNPQKDVEKGQYLGTHKYSAAKLKEKGVLLSVDGASDSQLKHVTLELTSKETGVFDIKAGFLGIKYEETILFQDLLQLQYENVTTMRMFDMCTVNVNLLVFLINKKFYGKG